MIVSKILLSSGFSGLISYVLSSTKEIKPEHVATRHLFQLSRAAREMDLVAARNTRVINPVAHIIVTWSKDENVDIARQHEAAHEILAALGLSDHQALIVVHDEPKDGVRPGPNGRHYEMHVVVNRVHPRGTVNNMSHSFVSAEVAAKRVSEQLGFAVVPGRFNKAGLDKHGTGQVIGSIRAESGRPTIAEELLASSASMDLLREARRKGWPELLAAFADLGVIIAPPPAKSASARGRAKRRLQRGLVMIDAAETDRRIKISALDTPYEKWGAIALARDLGAVPYESLHSIETAAHTAREPSSSLTAKAAGCSRDPRANQYRQFKIEESKATKERRQQVADAKCQRSKIYLEAKAEAEALLAKARLRRRIVTSFCGRGSVVGAALNAVLDLSLDTRLLAIKTRRNAEIAALNAQAARDRIAIPRWAEWQRRNENRLAADQSTAGSRPSASASPIRSNPSHGRPIFGAPRHPTINAFRTAASQHQAQRTRAR